MSQLVDKKGRVWHERTVIVKKEEQGFGFTLSQERPVFVEKIYFGSSAHRAGIVEGDRIMKVNGVEVMGHKHTEVVDMIRDSTHVTLTIIGKANGTKTPSAQPSPPVKSETSTPPVEVPPLRERTQQNLKSMLQKQRKTYETLSVEFSRDPVEKIVKELKDCENMIKILQEELAAKTPAIDVYVQTNSANIMAMTGKERTQPSIDAQLNRKIQGLSYSKDDVDVHDGPVSPIRTPIATGSPKPTRSQTFSVPNGLSPNKILSWNRASVNKDDSDDDLSDEVASDAGPFSSLQELKGHPAHLAVFLHYLYLTKDPKHLLFYLVTNSYQNNLSRVEDLKQRGRDIFLTFFHEASPLPLDISHGARDRIIGVLGDCDQESKLKTVFVEVRDGLTETIINDLGNYRHKRVIGLAGMFNDHLLSKDMSKQKHIEVVLSTLVPDLKQLLDDKANTGVLECVKNQAIAACMATFILDQLSIKGGSKQPPILDKVQSFTKPDLLLKKASKKNIKKIVQTKGHMFNLTRFSTPTHCDQCQKLLWGVVYHGYQCSQCDINLHKHCCITELAAECAGQQKVKGNKGRRSSMLRNKIFVIGNSEETDGSRTDGSMDYLSRSEDDEQSPPTDYAHVPNYEKANGGSELSTPVTKRDRSRSDPHTNSVLIDNEAGPHDHPTPTSVSRDNVVKRTWSEKLPPGKKPDLFERHLSGDGVSHGSSEESQTIRAGGSQEAIESNTSASSKLPVVDEDNLRELSEDNVNDDPTVSMAWAEVAPSKLQEGMRKEEILRQNNIRELLLTERNHLYKLKIMKYMYKVPLQKQGILPPRDIEQLFPSLEELILFHAGFCTQLKERVGPSNNVAVTNIADVLLQRFEGSAGDRLSNACSVFASNQARAEKLLREWKRKNDKLRLFIRGQESHPLSYRHILTELLPIAWNRLTRYQLLIERIVKSYKKDLDNLDESEKVEFEKTERAQACVKNILEEVNTMVRASSQKQKLMELQSKIDFAGMDKTQHPIAKLYKNLDLCAEGRTLRHEGSLTWRLQHRKVLELHALLFNDVLVLLEKHEDKDKYLYRCHTVENVSGAKEELSPVIRLQDCLLRHAAADRGGRTFLLVNNSGLIKFAQMYEFIAESPTEKKLWEDSIKEAMTGSVKHRLSSELPCSPLGDDGQGLSALTNLNPREQLNKIDEDMKKLHDDKLKILRAMQGVRQAEHQRKTSTDSTKKDDLGSKGLIWSTIEQAGEITSTVSHIMVPNPTKGIIAETQHKLTNVIHELQKNLSKLLIMTGGQSLNGSLGSIPALDLDLTTESLVSAGESTALEPTTPSSGRVSSASGSSDIFNPNDMRAVEEPGREMVGSTEMLNIPSPIPELDESSRDDSNLSPDFPPPPSYDELSALSSGSSLTAVVAPPDIFCGDESVTPTPGMDNGSDSQVSTPRIAEPHFAEAMALATTEGKVSPLVLASHSKTNSRDLTSSPHTPGSTTGAGLRDNSTPPRDDIKPLGLLLRRSTSPSNNKLMSVYANTEHITEPSVEITDDCMPSYSLSRRSTTTSLNSDTNSVQPDSPTGEGSDL